MELLIESKEKLNYRIFLESHSFSLPQGLHPLSSHYHSSPEWMQEPPNYSWASALPHPRVISNLLNKWMIFKCRSSNVTLLLKFVNGSFSLRDKANIFTLTMESLCDLSLAPRPLWLHPFYTFLEDRAQSHLRPLIFGSFSRSPPSLLPHLLLDFSHTLPSQWDLPSPPPPFKISIPPQ